MLTPKIRRTNLVKDNSGFKVGGYARSRAFGTRIYKVIDIERRWQNKYSHAGAMIGHPKAWVEGFVIKLVKIGETNKGRFKFTNSRPFEVMEHDTGHWYYPAKGI